jgi:undecaprenyl phosphate-alpha-L-ara4N flippase subunit ArnE
LRQGAASAAGKRSLLNAPMIAWLWCYAGSTLLWLIALRTIPLSQAFPILGLQYALIPLVSGRLLGEPMGPGQRIGIIIIVIGVGLVGQS